MEPRPSFTERWPTGVILLLLLTAALLCVSAVPSGATDLPPAGRSLFDHLISRTIDGRSVQHIPYPFAALLDDLRGHTGTDALGRPGVAAVLIPLGRSLQRNASAAGFFRHPAGRSRDHGRSARA